MNWKYLVPRLCLVAILWSFLKWGFDPASRHGLRYAGEQALGGRVVLGDLRTTFASPTLTLTNVAIADRNNPLTNLVEFDELHVEVARRPLMQKCVVIEQARLSGLRWNTPRTEPGDIAGWKPVWKRKLDLDAIPGIDLDLDLNVGDAARSLGKEWLEELLDSVRAAADPQQFESVKVANQLEKEWPARFDDFKQRIEELEERIEQLKQVADVKGKALDRLDAYQKAAAEVQQFLADVQTLRDELKGLPKVARNDFTRLAEAKDRDLERLKEALNPLELDPAALTEALLSGRLKERLTEMLAWVRRIREFSQTASADFEPVRARGSDILFERRPAAPTFLLQQLEFDGQTTFGGAPLTFSGRLADVTSDPKSRGTPITWELTASGASQLSLRGTIDRTGDTPSEQVDLAWTLPTPVEMALGDAKSFALQLSAARTEWTAHVEHTGRTTSGRIAIKQTPVTLAFAGRRAEGLARTPGASPLVQTASAESTGGLIPAVVAAASPEEEGRLKPFDLEGMLERVLGETLAGIRSLEAALTFTSAGAGLEMSLDSNLGEQLAGGLRGGLTRAIDEERDGLAERLEGEMARRMTGLRTMMGQRYQPLLADLNAHEAQARSLIQQVSGTKPLDVKLPKSAEEVKSLQETLRDPKKLLRLK